MKVVKKTGLVPVCSNANGSVFGVDPKTAAEWVKTGQATLADIPEGIETIEVNIEVLPAPTVEEPPVAVDIPDDWESLHHLQRVKLAKQLLGVETLTLMGEEKPSDHADRVIREELQRRAAAAQPTE